MGEYVFLDKPPLANVSDSQAGTLARKPHSRFQSRKAGPFRIVSVQKNTITIDKEVLPNTISVGRVTHEPAITRQPQRATTPVPLERDLTKHSTRGKALHNEKENEKYVAQRIVRHIGKWNNLRCMVRWNDYGAKNDSAYPAHHIPQHLIA